MKMYRKEFSITLKNLISGIAVQVLSVLYGLIFPALIILKYGSVLNGLVSSITQFIGYLAIVEMGIYNASLVVLYAPVAVKNYNRINGIMAQIQKFYNKIARIFVILSLIAAFLYPLLIKDNIPRNIIIQMVLVVAGINLITYLFLGKYRVFLQADNKIYIVNLIRIVGLFIQIFLCTLCIIWNLSIVGIKAAVIISNFVEFLLLYYYCKKQYPLLDFRVEPLHNSIQQRSDILAHQVAGLIVNNSSTIILTVFGNSLSLVSVYFIYNMINIMALNFADTLISSVSAKFGQLLALKKFGNLKNNMDHFEFIYNICIFVIYTNFALLIMPFVRLYTRNITDINYDVVSLGIAFSIMGLTRVFRSPYTLLISAAGHYKQTRIQAINEAWICLSVSIFFVLEMGIQGVVLGTICSQVYRTIHSYIYCYYNIIRFDLRKSIIRLIRNSLIWIIFLSIQYRYLILRYTPESYLEFGLLVSIEILLCVCFFFFINLWIERKKLRDVIRLFL